MQFRQIVQIKAGGKHHISILSKNFNSRAVTEDRFERIGTTYYKIVRQPNAAGQLIERSIPWTIEAIRQDYVKDYLANVPKYDGHRCVASRSVIVPHSAIYKQGWTHLIFNQSLIGVERSK